MILDSKVSLVTHRLTFHFSGISRDIFEPDHCHSARVQTQHEVQMLICFSKKKQLGVLSNLIIKKHYPLLINYHRNNCMVELSGDETGTAPDNFAGLACTIPEDHS